MTNTLEYRNTDLVTMVKSFVVESNEANSKPVLMR
jgi:hypothetical protein